ncbi:MAG: UvrD-helicase domain-containing protein, partial [Bacilli bacterium]|nr:UvrD-helicase domain-containing protein [Bacilli bacterium]
MHNRYLLQKLSQNQLDAIEESGNLLLVAIPGSGKTRTLTNKVLYEYDTNASRLIVAITYTNRAVEEMRERIFNQLGFIPSNIWIGTIHKFCLDFIIRKYSRFSVTLSKPFTIIGEKDSKDLKKRLLDKYGLRSDNYIDYTLDVFGNVKEKYIPAYVREYYKELLDMRMIDFNYILYEAYKILNAQELVAKQLSSLISVLCIDEYQDTQELQYQILSLIYKKRKEIKLFIVGDPNQAIYTNMGGVVKSKEELEEMFETGFSQKQLDCCYRSHQKVIDFYRNFALQDFEMNSGNVIYNAPEIKI